MAGVGLSAPQARFAWQAWHFLYHHSCQRKLGDEVGLMWRRGLLRGRRGTFGTSGSICVAGVRRGTFGTSGSICVAGVVLSLPPYRSAEAWRRSRTDVAPRSFAWQAWHFRHLRLDLRGRRGAFCTTIEVSGSLATK